MKLIPASAKSRAVLVAALLLLFPILHMKGHVAERGGWLGFIYFGREFESRRLPAMDALDPPVTSRWGYDGQFYSQIALRPSLEDPALIGALDNPTYRARRIGLPFLAWCVGLGRPAWVVYAYAGLGFIFWLALWLAVVRRYDLSQPRDALLAASMLCTTGAAYSLLRAVPDFPAAVLGVLALWLATSRAPASSVLMAASGLTKETALLALAALLDWKGRSARAIVARNLAVSLVAILPLALWVAYVHARLGFGQPGGSGNFALPFAGLGEKLPAAALHMIEGLPSLPLIALADRSLEFLAPASIAVQAAFLLLRPRLSDPAWRFGVGFALLVLVLGPAVWAEQAAYTRSVLPLTFAFNLLVHRLESQRAHFFWFTAGNFGLVWGLLDLLDGY